MKTYRIYQIDSFTKERFYGNPAGVVANADGLSEAQMQQIARELNNSETAFILSPTQSGCDVRVRFFTPTTEVPICGHATIAAHYVRAIENNFENGKITIQQTGAGNLAIETIKKDDDYAISMTQGKPEIHKPFDENLRQKLATALNLKTSDFCKNLPICIVGTGHPKVMVPLNNAKSENLPSFSTTFAALNENLILHHLKPNFNALSELSDEIDCNGFYCFTLNENSEFLAHGRMFAPAIGINEDPVTGNANGPLGAYLVTNGFGDPNLREFRFKIMQGEAINRAGSMEVVVECKQNTPIKVQIIGSAVIAFKTEIYL